MALYLVFTANTLATALLTEGKTQKTKTIRIMSKAKTNPFGGLSALLGDRIFIRKVRGQYQLINRPARRAKPTPTQLVNREKFREAAQYARVQISREVWEALYAKGITKRKRTSYLVALSDFLNAPRVKGFTTDGYRGRVGDSIIVKASDDFMVTKVKIAITNAAGTVIEQGETTPSSEIIDGWEYKATVSNPSWTGTTISAIAYDRPGNKGTGEVVL